MALGGCSLEVYATNDRSSIYILVTFVVFLPTCYCDVVESCYIKLLFLSTYRLISSANFEGRVFLEFMFVLW